MKVVQIEDLTDLEFSSILVFVYEYKCIFDKAGQMQ